VQLRHPVRIGIDACLGLRIQHAPLAQFGAHPIGPVAARRLVGNKILQIAAVVDQFLRAQPLDQRSDHSQIVTLVEQLTAQLVGCMVAPRQRIERRDPGCARIERLYLAAAQTLRLFGVATPIHGRLLGNQFGANLSLDVLRHFRMLL